MAPAPQDAAADTPPVKQSFTDIKPIQQTFTDVRPIPQPAQQTFTNIQPIGAPPPQTADNGDAAIAALNRENAPHTVGMKISAGAEDLLKGLGEGALDTVTGVSGLIHKIPGVGETLAPQSGIDRANELAKPADTMQEVGKLGENALEWAGGEELFKGVTTLAKVPEGVLALAEKYPKAAKLIFSAAKEGEEAKKLTAGAKIAKAGVEGAAIGGAQGAVKGEATNQAKEGAEGGAAGGALGTAIAEGIAPATKFALRKLGLGLTGAESVSKAARPSVAEGRQGFEDNLRLVLPRIVREIKEGAIPKFKTLGEFSDAIHDSADRLWTTEVVPQIQRHANEVVEGTPIAQRIRQSVTEGMAELLPEKTKTIEDMAQKFTDSKLSLAKSENYLRTINAELRGYYKLSPEAQYAARSTNGNIAAMESTADALRDGIYDKLESLGETGPRELRQEYGALKQIQRVFEHRATVADRQNPISLTQLLGYLGGAGEAAGAVLSGHPVAAAGAFVPIAVAETVKRINAPETLLKSGLKKAASEIAGPSAVGEAVKGAIKTGVEAGGAATGEKAEEWPALESGHTRFVDSSGTVHDIPSENLEKARELDPNLKVLAHVE